MILFRADGNANVGLGHVMRNLSIADAFHKLGEANCFAVADESMQELIACRGYEVKVLGTKYDQMDTEIDLLEDLVKTLRPKALLVDSYFVTDTYLHSLHEICKEANALLVYVDDVLAFPYECDVLINYNIYATPEEYRRLYKDLSLPELLLGTMYAPLRTEFQGLKNRKLRMDAKDILISTGGADFEHFGLELLRAILRHDNWNNYRFHFVIGAMNEDKVEIERIASNAEHICLHKNVSNMSELMQACDVAVSAAGSTLYELCVTQTPSVTYILADNQIPGAEGFTQKGVLSNAGDVRVLGLEQLANNVLNEAVDLLNDFEKRSAISEKMKSVVDGNGAERIASEILCRG